MQFLRGDFKGEVAQRPPWSISEDLFTTTCDRCDKCIKACPPRILKRGASGFPEMNFSKAGCDFCQACAQNCPTKAIHLTPSNQDTPWQLAATFKNNCLSENGVVCRSCGDVCETRAIRFKLVVGGAAMIEMNSLQCNGCGECVSLCPVGAIEMKAVDQTEIFHE